MVVIEVRIFSIPAPLVGGATFTEASPPLVVSALVILVLLTLVRFLVAVPIRITAHLLLFIVLLAVLVLTLVVLCAASSLVAVVVCSLLPSASYLLLVLLVRGLVTTISHIIPRWVLRLLGVVLPVLVAARVVLIPLVLVALTLSIVSIALAVLVVPSLVGVWLFTSLGATST